MFNAALEKILFLWIVIYIGFVVATSMSEGTVVSHIKNGPAQYFSNAGPMKMELVCDYGKIQVNATRNKVSMSVKTAEPCLDTTDKDTLATIRWDAQNDVDVNLETRWFVNKSPLLTDVFQSETTVWSLVKLMYLPQDLKNSQLSLNKQGQVIQSSLQMNGALAKSLVENEKLWPSLVVKPTNPTTIPVPAKPVTQDVAPKPKVAVLVESSNVDKPKDVDINRLISGQ